MMIADKFGFGLLKAAFLLQPLGSQAQEPSEPLKKVSKLKFDKRGALLFDFIEMFPDSSESAERVNQFTIEHNVTLSEITPNAKRVQLWISLPGDERNQKLMNLEVNDCPGKWRLVNDLDRRGNFLFVEESTVDHYSYTKDPSMPTCGIGDASVCKKR